MGYSVASDTEDVSEEQKVSLRRMKEYSVLSESEDKDEGHSNTKITKVTKNQTVVVSLEKNEQISAQTDHSGAAAMDSNEKQETTQRDLVKPPEEPVDQPKTYSRKKKKDKKSVSESIQPDQDKDVDTSLPMEETIIATESLESEKPPKQENEIPQAKEEKKKKKPAVTDELSPTMAKEIKIDAILGPATNEPEEQKEIEEEMIASEASSEVSMMKWTKPVLSRDLEVPPPELQFRGPSPMVQESSGQITTTASDVPLPKLSTDSDGQSHRVVVNAQDVDIKGKSKPDVEISTNSADVNVAMDVTSASMVKEMPKPK